MTKNGLVKCAQRGVAGGLFALFLQGIPADAALLAYDGFDTSAAGDAANGIYRNGTSFTDSINNAVSGGDIVGFSAAWTHRSGDTSVLAPLNNTGNAGVTASTAGTMLTRGLDASMSGKTAVYLGARIRMDMTGAVHGSSAFVGVASSSGNASRGGSFGFLWDANSGSWDLTLRRYDKTNGWQYDVVADNVAAADTGWQYVVLRVDEANETLDVWLNPTSTNAVATLSATDYLGAVNDVGSLTINTVKLNGTGSGFSFDEMRLGDEMKDVIPPPTLGLFAITTP